MARDPIIKAFNCEKCAEIPAIEIGMLSAFFSACIRYHTFPFM